MYLVVNLSSLTTFHFSPSYNVPKYDIQVYRAYVVNANYMRWFPADSLELLTPITHLELLLYTGCSIRKIRQYFIGDLLRNHDIGPTDTDSTDPDFSPDFSS